MNPYEEPDANLEVTQDTRPGIQWLSIALAVIIWFAAERAMQYVPFYPDLDQPFKSFLESFFLLFLVFGFVSVPWFAAAIFLALRVRQRWVLHAVIYATTFSIACLVFSFALAWYSGDIPSVSSCVELVFVTFMFSIVSTIVVMAVPRIIFNLIQQRKAKVGLDT